MTTTWQERARTASRWSWLLLTLIALVGLYLRVWHLGELGLHGDEDITTLAVRSILDHGYPLLPGGMVYLRALPFHYILAGSVSLLGMTEFALRLPAALFSAFSPASAFQNGAPENHRSRSA